LGLLQNADKEMQEYAVIGQRRRVCFKNDKTHVFFLKPLYISCLQKRNDIQKRKSHGRDKKRPYSLKKWKPSSFLKTLCIFQIYRRRKVWKDEYTTGRSQERPCFFSKKMKTSNFFSKLVFFFLQRERSLKRWYSEAWP